MDVEGEVKKAYTSLGPSIKDVRIFFGERVSNFDAARYLKIGGGVG